MSHESMTRDLVRRPQPDAVHLRSLIGKRLDVCRVNRLRHQEAYHLLFPFQEHCPVGWGSQPHPEITRGDWQGEFLGTWIDAASLSAWNAGDDELRSKVDGMVAQWLATQEEDGYLGTYDEEDRWKSWDVWVQAHDLIGLMSYFRFTGSTEARDAAVRVANRVLQDFGPGKRHLHTGPHGGMASAAILEPLIWLYWETGEGRYLEWGRWLVDEDWEAEGGPAIVSSLLSGNGVARTGNAKAAEMLIDFTGMLELYRATDDERYLKPVLLAWDDIVNHHLYVTGSASTGEYFQADFALRNDGLYRLGETCVTMTWMYLNLSLGRLTGEARFFDMVEQTLYNHLLGAQSPDGRGWAYYMGLRDSKRYRWHTDPDCCPKRGSRALAQMPQHILGLTDDGLVVNFFEAAEAELRLSSGLEVNVTLEGDYPFDGSTLIKLNPRESDRFAVHLRLPAWCEGWQLQLNGQPHDAEANAKGYLVVDRVWQAGDELGLELAMPVRVLVDELGNAGRVALTRGPLVFAADSALLPPGRLLDDVILALDETRPEKGIEVKRDAESGGVRLVVPVATPEPAKGTSLWKEIGRYHDLAGGATVIAADRLELVPFYEAGDADPHSYRDGVWPNTEKVTNISYQVWLPYLLR
jgi:DUF1680 family protein